MAGGTLVPVATSATLPRVDTLTIRHARPDDVPALVAFWQVAGENGSRPADHDDAVAHLIARDPEALIVAELDRRIVATIIAGWDGWRANLYRLAVDPELRGRGLGRRMVEQAEERLRAFGAERFCAMVLDENDGGRGLWESLGYAPQAEWSRWVKSAW